MVTFIYQTNKTRVGRFLPVGGKKMFFCHLNSRLLFFDKRLVLSYYIQLWFHLFSVTKFVLLTYLLIKNMYNV